MNKFYKSIIILLWFLVIGTLLFYYRYQIFNPFYEMVQIYKSEKATRFEFDLALGSNEISENETWTIFYDTGRGFNQVELLERPYPENINPNDFQHYFITLPTVKTIKRLRFDPLRGSGTVLLKNLEVHRFHTEKIPLEMMVSKIIPKNGIETITPIDNGIRIATNGPDPQVVISVDFEKYVTKNRSDYFKVFNKIQLSVLAINGCLLFFFIMSFVRKRNII